MADRPILFSGPMVRALLDGRKTQTRRVLPVQPSADEIAGYRIGGAVCDPVAFPDRPYVWLRGDDGSPVMPIINPPRIIQGDRLYVREAWRTHIANEDMPPRDLMPRQDPIRYEADEYLESWEMPFMDAPGRFRQGMHMPRWASRLTLTVTDVRVQRLQEITAEDALAEGIVDHRQTIIGAHGTGGHHHEITADGYSHVDEIDPDNLPDFWDSPTEAFSALWDGLNYDRGYGWQTSPWVIAYTFTLARQNIDATGAKGRAA